MTNLEVLNILEDRLQHISTSVPTHVQIKQVIEFVRQEIKKEDEIKED